MKIPRQAKILGVVFGLLLLLAILVPYFLDLDRYRPRIVNAIESKTGRKASIGKIRARFLPSLGFTLEKVTLGSPAGFGDVNLLTADALRGSLAYRPLFRGEYDVSSLELVKPKVVLAEDERGRTNYDFSSPAGTKGGAPPTSSSIALPSVELTDAELTSARVVGPKQSLVPLLKLTGVNVRLTGVNLDPGGMKKWKGDIPLSGVKIEVAGLKGGITFRSGNLKLEQGRLDGKYEAELGTAAKVKGELHVPSLEKPQAMVDMTTPLLDLDQLSSATESAPPSAPARASPRSGKGELMATLKVKADRVRYSPYEGTNATGELRVYDNRMEGPLTMALYGGSLGISVHLDTAQVPERFSANLQVSQLDLEKLVAAYPATRGKVTGKGELKLQLFGSVDKNPLASLSGDGSFALRDGRLPGVQLGESMKALSRVEQVLSLGGGGGAKGETTFSLVNGDLQIRNSRVASQKIHADTNVGSGDMRGSVGFDSTLDYAGQWTLTPGAGDSQNPGSLAGVLGKVLNKKGASLSVPFTLTGTLKEPKLRPGEGVPSFKTSSPAPTTQQTQPPKKSILDIFKKP